MISHVVYRGRNNPIVLQLQNDGAPVTAISRVELCINGTGIHIDSTQPFVEYAPLTGVLTMQLGRITAVTDLTGSSYIVDVTGYASGDTDGTFFGNFGFTLADPC